MKKIILPLMIMLTIGALGYKYGFDTLFTPGAVKKVRASTVEELQESIDDAEKEYEDQLASAERVGNAYERLGKEYLKRKEWTPGINALTKAVGYGSNGARTHYFLGLAYANRAKELESRKDIKKAKHHYGRALEENSQLTDAEYGLALVTFYLEKNRKKGITQMKKIVRRDPEYYQARFALGRFLYEDREPARALSVYESLYSDLQKKEESPKIKEMKKNCKENISRLMMEISR